MRTKIHALVLYFDAFFTTTAEPVPQEEPVRLTKDGDVTLAEVWPIAGKPPPKRRASVGPGLKEREEKRIISFSTGPMSQPTHWMQTLFLLKDPIAAEEGTWLALSLFPSSLLTDVSCIRYGRVGHVLLQKERGKFEGAGCRDSLFGQEARGCARE